MTIVAEFRADGTSRTRSVKVGWSWTLFLFSTLFGLPLFYRGLTTWGMLFLVLWVVSYGAEELLPDTETNLVIVVLLWSVGPVLSIWLGAKGNELTAKTYLDSGWKFVHPESDSSRLAKVKWGLADATPSRDDGVV